MKLCEILSRRLYHGTTLSKAESIMKNGFDLSLSGTKSDSPMPGISTTINKIIAKEHADWAAKKFKDDPVVLQIDSNALSIMSGQKLFKLHPDLKKALSLCKESGFDGAELFDFDEEIGFEDFEVLLFYPEKIKGIRIT